MIESQLSRLDSEIAWSFDHWVTCMVHRVEEVPSGVSLALPDAVRIAQEGTSLLAYTNDGRVLALLPVTLLAGDGEALRTALRGELKRRGAMKQ
jgi:hypothetical protein